MPRIFVTGLCATTQGAMEQQLGNVAILIPMIRLLHQYIPDAEIVSNIQVSDDFCTRHRLISIRNKDLYSWGKKDTLRSILSYFRTCIWRVIYETTHLNLKFLINGKLLKEYISSDIILSLDGDILSEYLPIKRFVKHTADLLSARNLHIPVVEFASSPGPFESFIKRRIAKFLFNRLTVLSNREPISKDILVELGVTKPPIISACCPAFHLEPCSKEWAIKLLSNENINIDSRYLVGICIAGPNMKNIYKAKEDELLPYVPMLKFLLEEIKATVILIPHVYRTNPYTGEHIHGPDHVIAQQLYKVVEGEKYDKKLKVIEGIFTPSEAKGIFGQLDLFISGRLHAAIGALSQGIPTVMLAYGHKHYGVAELLGITSCVYGGKDPEKILSVVKETWGNRMQYRRILNETLSQAKELSKTNFVIISDILSLSKEKRNGITKSMLDRWLRISTSKNHIDMRFINEDIKIRH